VARTLAALAALCALAAPAAPASADTIREIVIAENSKTTDETVRFLAGIKEGQSWDLDKQERVRIELVSSGLFKSVELFTEPHEKGGVKVTIVAKDKHSWVVAPTYYNQPTNKGGGVGFGENNLFGQNKKLLTYGQIATGDSFFIGAYVDPSIRGTAFKWQLDVFLRRERVKEYVPQNRFIFREGDGRTIQSRGDPIVARESKIKYLNTGLKFGFEIRRALSVEGRFRGAHVSYTLPKLGEGATEDLVDASLTPGCLGDGTCALPKPGAEGWDVSAEAIFKLDRIANWYGIASGDRFQFSYEKSLSALGSDFDYTYMGLSYLRARRYFKAANLILRANADWGSDIPFQQEFTSGGTTLRGYKNRQFRGDFKTGMNVEYSLQLFNIRGFALRTLAFVDSTYTTFLRSDSNEESGVRNYLPGHTTMFSDSKLAPWRNSIGLGTRVYIRQIVLPLLGLDLGYGLESGGFEVYFAIGLTDF
jgi:outer membrane protein insertion porin family